MLGLNANSLRLCMAVFQAYLFQVQDIQMAASELCEVMSARQQMLQLPGSFLLWKARWIPPALTHKMCADVNAAATYGSTQFASQLHLCYNGSM